jgi:hypothetical protein
LYTDDESWIRTCILSDHRSTTLDIKIAQIPAIKTFDAAESKTATFWMLRKHYIACLNDAASAQTRNATAKYEYRNNLQNLY